MTVKEPSAKELFIRATLSFLLSEKATYYARGDRVYLDSACMNGTKLLLIENGDFRSFLMRFAKRTENILLRSADIDLIAEHVVAHAREVAKPLAEDTRSCELANKLYINTGWENGKVLVVEESGEWHEEEQRSMFEPIPPKMRMTVPAMREAGDFPALLRTGIADFGDMHCLLCVSCATMLLPATFSHPFIVFTGDQARGKSTTMKLLLQLVDPYEGGELMTVGEDMRDLIALVRGRHSIALDNVSKLPFEEDLLSKMYSGGLFAARKMTTNADISEVTLPRLRVMINGIGTAFSRSDLMSRCIFIEHPLLTAVEDGGFELFEALSIVENRWKAMLPEVLGSLLRGLGSGLRLFRSRGGYTGKQSRSRFVEYCVLGECIAEEMGFKPGLFTEQCNAATEAQKQGAIESDDCAQLFLAWRAGERGGEMALPFGDTTTQNEYIVTTSELFSEIKALAIKKGYSVYSMKWLSCVNQFSARLRQSAKNIENAGWYLSQIKGGNNKRKWTFVKI